LLVGAALVAVFIAIVAIVRPHPSKKGGAKVAEEKAVTPTPVASASPAGSRADEVATPAPTSTATAIVVLPPHKEPTLTPSPFVVVSTPTPRPAVIQVQFDLGKAIAEAAPDSTVRVPAGVYRGGFVVRQPLHLVGEANGRGPVVIQNQGKEGLAVEAKNVSVSGMQFVAQDTSTAPAITVAQGAELTLDGCKVNSESNLGVTVGQNGLLKTVSTTFISPKGAAIQLECGAKGSFSRSAVKESLIGLRLTGGATAELHGCAFENNGQSHPDGAAIDVSGEKTQLAADDCHFTTNTGGINVSERATLDLSKSSFRSNGASFRGLVGLIVVSTGGSAKLTDDQFESNRSGVLVTRGGKIDLEKCSFDQNGFAQTGGGVVAGSLPLSIGGEGSSGIVRQSTFARSTPYAISAIDSGEVTLEDAEISGSSEVGLLVGDRSAPGGHAEIKNSHFLGNAIGLGICAGGSAAAEASEFRENRDGVVVLDPESQLRLTNSKLLRNRRQGLHVFLQATANLSDCELQDNIQGALSGSMGKADERAAVTLENCRFGQNHVFGAGAGRDSELVLKNCTFDGSDKENLYKDRGAKVTVNASPGESPSPSSSADADKSHQKRSHRHATPRPHFPNPEDVRRTLRKLLPGGD
jgi:hypothetical protein